MGRPYGPPGALIGEGRGCAGQAPAGPYAAAEGVTGGIVMLLRIAEFRSLPQALPSDQARHDVATTASAQRTFEEGSGTTLKG